MNFQRAGNYAYCTIKSYVLVKLYILKKNVFDVNLVVKGYAFGSLNFMFQLIYDSKIQKRK